MPCRLSLVVFPALFSIAAGAGGTQGHGRFDHRRCRKTRGRRMPWRRPVRLHGVACQPVPFRGTGRASASRLAAITVAMAFSARRAARNRSWFPAPIAITSARWKARRSPARARDATRFGRTPERWKHREAQRTVCRPLKKASGSGCARVPVCREDPGHGAPIQDPRGRPGRREADCGRFPFRRAAAGRHSGCSSLRVSYCSVSPPGRRWWPLSIR